MLLSEMFLDIETIITTIIKHSLEVHWVSMNLLIMYIASVKKDKELGKKITIISPSFNEEFSC